jgi:hypothetical protein
MFGTAKSKLTNTKARLGEGAGRSISNERFAFLGWPHIRRGDEALPIALSSLYLLDVDPAALPIVRARSPRTNPIHGIRQECFHFAQGFSQVDNHF